MKHNNHLPLHKQIATKKQKAKKPVRQGVKK